MVLRFILALILLAIFVAAAWMAYLDNARVNAFQWRLPRSSAQRSISFAWFTSCAGRFEIQFQRTTPADPDYADYYRDFTRQGELLRIAPVARTDWRRMAGGEKLIDFEFTRRR